MTYSEQIFDDYLTRRRIKFEIEKGVLVHPDRFLYLKKGLVICEIKQLEGRLPFGKLIVSDPYKKIRKAIKSKVRQGSEAKKESTPYVIVLFNYGSPQILSNQVVEAAMYGDLSIIIDIPQDIKQKGKVRGTFFAGNGLLRHARSHEDSGKPFNQRISAIAILEVINPTDNVLIQEYNKVSKNISLQDIDAHMKILHEVTTKLTIERKYKKDFKIPRLRVFHNIYAYNPLGFDVLIGKYDQQYYIDPATGQSRKYKKN